MTKESEAEKAIWRLHRAHSSARPDYRDGWNEAVAAAAGAVKDLLKQGYVIRKAGEPPVTRVDITKPSEDKPWESTIVRAEADMPAALTVWTEYNIDARKMHEGDARFLDHLAITLANLMVRSVQQQIEEPVRIALERELSEDVSFAPGAYIPARELEDAEIDEGAREVIRARSAFVAYHAAELVTLHTDNPIPLREVRKVRPLGTAKPGTVGAYFDIMYGLKSLHNKEALLPGDSLVISSSGMDNGCYGFFDFDGVLEPPFVTVPSTGSIAIAHVQEWPCGVTDDCLVLLPKEGVSHALLYVAAAAIRNERWRFSYGRKATPGRIADFPLPHTDSLLVRIDEYLTRAARVEDMILDDAEDALDSLIARNRIAELKDGTTKIVSGAALNARLAALSED